MDNGSLGSQAVAFHIAYYLVLSNGDAKRLNRGPSAYKEDALPLRTCIKGQAFASFECKKNIKEINRSAVPAMKMCELKRLTMTTYKHFKNGRSIHL